MKMHYLPEEKKKITALFNAFHAYLENHWAIDVVYSARFGYVYVAGMDARSNCVIKNAEHLFALLVDDIIMDVIFSKENELRTEDELAQSERMEIRRRVAGILATMREGQEAYMRLLERIMEAFRRSELDDRELSDSEFDD